MVVSFFLMELKKINRNKIEYYGYVYVTINLINFKTYVGQHKASTFDKAYHGSGIIYKKAVKKIWY